ncbi:MAG: ABC transporter permease [Chloroflexales bacterium]|nr:ABC transporter permease [Chloroflexales bacterium]
MIEASSQPASAVTARPRSARRSLISGSSVLALHSALVYGFLYLPIIVLVLFSFTPDSFGVRLTGFTLRWYADLFRDEDLIGATINTFTVATISTAVSTVLGTLIALGMERYRFRGRTTVDALIYMPIVIPEIVMAVALLAFFASVFGLIERTVGAQLRMSLATVTIAHIAFSISFVVVVVRASLKGFDTRLEEAASDLGANRWRTFWRVTFPLILPGIIGGALLAFTLSLDDFVISFFTAGPGTSLLPLEVYNKVKRQITPKINAVSTMMLLFSMALVLLSQYIQRRRR